MSIAKRVANRDAWKYVQDREEFETNNQTIYAYDTASTTGTDLYVVCSYGGHFPMYIAEEHEGEVNWYGNNARYSNTTTNHQSKTRPDADIMWFDADDMVVIMNHGITGLAAGVGA